MIPTYALLYTTLHEVVGAEWLDFRIVVIFLLNQKNMCLSNMPQC